MRKNKLFWIWLTAEVAAAGWFGWQIAKAETRPWARGPKTRKRNHAAIF